MGSSTFVVQAVDDKTDGIVNTLHGTVWQDVATVSFGHFK